MESPTLSLIELATDLAICRLEQTEAVPAWAFTGDFVSVTRTADELSIVCREDVVPAVVRCEKGWRCLRVAGKLDFSLVGVLASLTVPLAAASVSVFAISTFDTDYLLIRATDLARARQALQVAGYSIQIE